MIRNKINVLKSRFRKYKINGYIIPKNDDYFTEYAENDRLKKITGFSGSAGIAVILKKNNYLFVDGRYTIQAHQESSKNFKIIEIHKKLPNKIIKNCNLGYDPKLFTNNTLKKYFSNNSLVSIDNNLIDQISKFKKKQTKSFYNNYNFKCSNGSNFISNHLDTFFRNCFMIFFNPRFKNNQSNWQLSF